MKKTLGIISALAMMAVATVFMGCPSQADDKEDEKPSVTADYDFAVYSKDTDTTEFKSCVHAYLAESEKTKTVKQISFEAKADKAGIDLNFFFKNGKWNYVKPMVGNADGTKAADQYPKTTTEWQTLYTVNLPAGALNDTNTLYMASGAKNDGIADIGFEIYQTSGPQAVTVYIRNFKAIDQDGKEIAIDNSAFVFASATDGYPEQTEQTITLADGTKIYPKAE
ncbi:hypothetical protein [uncultured Treponema sp.]|uniref:hypothetical protein n=1 Tax=uncultured Treponema sp. TaxID=162155 RepID=UPI00259A6C97|nr:hypothetical protein [uncultured Treponema sp.]